MGARLDSIRVWFSNPLSHRRQPATLWLRMIAVAGLICASQASARAAAELPRLEEGYSYYCVGELEDSFFRTPNAMLVLKLRKDAVITYSAYDNFVCATDHVDLNFVTTMFDTRTRPTLDVAGIYFGVPVTVAGKQVNLRMGTGGGHGFAKRGRDDHYQVSRRVCEFEESPDKMGLYHRLRKNKSVCGHPDGFTAYGFPDGAGNPVRVWCLPGDKSCNLTFHYRMWTFLSMDFPREMLGDWRTFYEISLREIEKRVAFYYAPDGCIGHICGEVVSKFGDVSK